MPYPFTLPTTSFLSFPTHFESSTHPTLPYNATTSRAVVRSALKSHKRLPPAQRPSHLPALLNALRSYIPYLLALSAGLSCVPVAGEEVEITLFKEVEVEWRSTLSAVSIPGRETPRVPVRGLDAEIAFTLSTLARTHYLLARAQLRGLHDITVTSGAPALEQRTTAIAGAMQHLLSAHTIYAYLINLAPTIPAPVPADVAQTTLTALAALTLAEATLLAVLKDDPYPSVIAASRNAHDKDWMIAAPSIPKVRTHLFARLCQAAAEHANRGVGILATGAGASSKGPARLADDLPRYLTDLRRTARAKACRFLGIDAEASGQTGTAITWLRGGAQELSSSSAMTSSFNDTASTTKSKSHTFSALKNAYTNRREDRRIAADTEWGADAGALDECRILDLLDRKWGKLNDTVNVQIIPPTGPLLATLPSGREYHAPRPWRVLELDQEAVSGMRGPVEVGQRRAIGGLRSEGEGDDSGDEGAGVEEPVGAFPGSGREYY